MAKNIKFPTLKAAINSWYGSKVDPRIIVTLADSTQITGDLCSTHVYDTNITVELKDASEQTKTQLIPVSSIRQVDLTWTGSDLPEMGEPDGTGLEGQPIPTRSWRHRISLGPDQQWTFEEVSLPPGHLVRQRYRSREKQS